MAEVVDVAFQENAALIVEVGKIHRIDLVSGEAHTASFHGFPDVVIRERLSIGHETLLLRIGGAFYRLGSGSNGRPLLEEEGGYAHIDFRSVFQLGVYGASVAIAGQKDIHAHVLRFPLSSEPRAFCLLAEGYNLEPIAARFLSLDEDSENPLRMDLDVYIRTSCPPIDARNHVIAMALDNSIGVGPTESRVLINLNGLFEEHEIPEVVALDEQGETLACALRDQRRNATRVLRIDIRPWLSGLAPQKPKKAVLGEAKMGKRLPKDAPTPDPRFGVIPLRISPSLDWLVAEANTIKGGKTLRRFFAVNLTWE